MIKKIDPHATCILTAVMERLLEFDSDHPQFIKNVLALDEIYVLDGRNYF